MFRKIWDLLLPFHRTFFWFIVLATLYETTQLANSYVISLVVRLFGDKILPLT